MERKASFVSKEIFILQTFLAFDAKIFIDSFHGWQAGLKNRAWVDNLSWQLNPEKPKYSLACYWIFQLIRYYVKNIIGNFQTLEQEF